MTQTIKFRLGDTLHFTIRLPNGGIYESVDNDVYPKKFGWVPAPILDTYGAYINPNYSNWKTWSIAPPNPNYQITALFTFKRVL